MKPSRISILKIWSIANFTTNTFAIIAEKNVPDQLTKATAAASQQRRKDSV